MRAPDRSTIRGPVFALLVSVSACAPVASAAEPSLPGPVTIMSDGPGTGLVLTDQTTAANLWLGKRDAAPWDPSQWLNVQSRGTGIRVLVGDREMIVADRFGGIYLKGDVFLGRTRLDARTVQLLAERADTQRTFWRTLALVAAANFLLTVVTCRIMLRRWRAM
jgi:hypothetical protein